MSDATEPSAEGTTDEERLEDLGERIEATRKRAAEDLEMGGRGRTFADEGVSRQVETKGDTEHPPGDR